MIDLATWQLSIPVGSPPKTIETSQLVKGYDGKYFESTSKSIFFWAPVTGSKTENAKYAVSYGKPGLTAPCATGCTETRIIF